MVRKRYRAAVRRPVLVLTAVAAFVASAVLPAAAETPEWADWSGFGGSAGDYAATMRLPGGFPEATMNSNSRGGSVGIISGASTWLSEGTPPGATYGSGRNEQYLNLRPRADREDTPSTTTYTFERPTPPGGWAFVLGDIDADEVTVTAKGSDGQPIDTADLGFQGEFNYCDAAGSPSCSGGDLPSWDASTATLTGNDDAADTEGASGWFEPTVPIKSLTFTFRWRSGFPVYQTWFATLTRDISGTVTVADGAEDCEAEGTTVNLFGPDGSELASTTADADGAYSFAGYTASDGYEVEIIPPSECVMDETAGEAGQQRRPANLGDDDATEVDFALREIVPVEVSGTVTDTDGNPLSGVTVTLVPEGGGPERTAVTDSEGSYVFDQVDPGEYTWDIVEPDGYTTDVAPASLTVPEGTEEPITDQDFVLQPDASLSGQVTAGGSPVGNVTVTITGPDGFENSTVTDAEGNYQFDLLPPGDYTVTVEPPEGYEVDGPGSLDETITDEDVTDVDFALFRPGALGGKVLDDEGAPVSDVTIEITGPDGAETLTTDAEGNYYLGDLPPGEYTIVMTVPDGYTTVGPATRMVTISTAGETRLDQDFEIALEQTSPPPGEPTDEPSEQPTDGATESPSSDELPDTGAPSSPALTAIALVLGVSGALALAMRPAFRRG